MSINQNIPTLVDIRSRDYDKPTIVKFRTGAPRYSWEPKETIRYCLAGCPYGFLHTTSGDVRTWGSYNGAKHILKQYKDIWY